MLKMFFCLLAISQLSWSGDQGFRFSDNFCNRKGQPGYNPAYLGECGNLTRDRFVNQRESELNLLGANLNSIYVENSQFQKGDWSHTSLRRALLFESRWFNLTAKSSDLRASHIKGGQFQNVNLKRSLFHGARLDKVNFENCNLSHVDFWGASLQEVSFRNSDLSHANLKRTFLLFNDFSGAKFNAHTLLPFSEQEALKKGMIKID